MSWDFKFGIEEEYFVNDAPKRDIAKGKIREFFASCRENISGDIQPEMLEPQIEIATKPSLEFAEARAQLASLRSSVGAVARDFNLSIMASGTHPLAVWSRVRPTAQPRYGKVMHDLQMLGSRNVLCGMHVHVEVPDLGMRVDIMNRIQPYLPLLLALSTSSPFWQAQRTGLLGYRLAAYRELPRTGFPDLFENEQDYQRYIDTLVAARAIENSSYVWWVIRPSLKHPTLELRVADSCTRLDDTIAIAALYRCLVRRLSLEHLAQCRTDRRLARHQRRERLAGAALRHPWQLRRREDAHRQARAASFSRKPWTSWPRTQRCSAASASSISPAGSSRAAPVPTSS